MNEDAGDVLIIGGGLGGLSLALALSSHGHAVTVLEARTQPATDRWGFTLWPSGLRVLDMLGVGASVRDHGTELEAMRWYFDDGREALSIDTRTIAGERSFVGVLPSIVERTLTCSINRTRVRSLIGWRVEQLQREPGRMSVSARHDDGRLARFQARLVVAADGPNSVVRRLLGLRHWAVRVPNQQVYTGIGGPLPFRHLYQSLGPRWAVTAVPMGPARSWLAVAVQGGDGHQVLRDYTRHEPRLEQAVEGLAQGWSLRPTNGYAPQWAADGIVLTGDAAHACLPHLGLGGSQTLEDVPVLVDVVSDALKRNDTSARALMRFRARRARTVAYAQRISLISALGTLRMIRPFRDASFRRTIRHPDTLGRFLRELVETGRPCLRTRAAVWLL